MSLRPVSSNPEVASHHATQVALTTALFAALRRLWPSIDQKAPEASLHQYTPAVAALVGEFSRASISLSADHYDAMREQAGVAGQFRTPVIDPATEAQVEAYLNKAAETFLRESQPEVDALLAQIESASAQFVLDAGRNEVITAVDADAQAKGWARVVRPGACYFCLMLATRGPVYRTEKSASFRAHQVFNGRGGDCQCTAEPVFGVHEPSAQVRAAKALWDNLPAGLSGKAAIRAFRRAVDAQRAAASTT